MIALLQRVRSAHVVVGGAEVARIDAGLLMFVCAEPADDEALAQRLVDKVLKLRVLADADGRMNRSLRDTGGGLLVVPQFTLAAELCGGNRPSFSGAAPPARGRELFEAVLQAARRAHTPVGAGVFGADMQVHLVNDGPVTIPLRLAPPR